ncbi:MAG: ATP-binding cassette domain-containing protein [Pirellulales bacterium]
MKSVSKRFGAVTALEHVSIDLHSGETVGVVGDNGAGKSTLLKIMSGVHPPDEGTLEVDGNAVTFESPRSARAGGIEAVYQDLALVDDMSVAENMFLGREVMARGLAGKLGTVSHKTMRELAAEAISKLRVRIPGLGDAIVRRMSGGQRQGAAIARAILWGRRILLLDEPTAALGVQEQGEVERLILELRDKRLPMMIIAHNLPLVFRLTDRIVVLRHGRVVARLKTSETTPEEVVSFITGAKTLESVEA